MHPTLSVIFGLALMSSSGLAASESAWPNARHDAKPAPRLELAQMPGMGGRGRQSGPAATPAPTNPPPAERSNERPIYHVDRADGVQGPFTRSAIERAVREGRVVADDMLWVPGEPAWKRADQFAELQPLFAGAAPSGRPAGPPSRPSASSGAPPASSGPATPAATAQAFMIGTWRLEAQLPDGGRGRSTMQYRPDGIVTGEWERSGPNGSQSGPINGRWQTRDVDAERFELVVMVDGGGQESVNTLRRVDQNTLYNETANATAHRIGP